MISEDKLRQCRPPAEREWQGNAHLDIVDTP
jgi:hypothetical protein